MEILVEYLKQNPEFELITMNKEQITFSGVTINLKDFDVEKFLQESNNLINDMATLPMKDVFNIIKIHVDYSNMMKKYEEEKAQKMVDDVIENSPSLRNFHIFKKLDNFGYQKSFLQYTDSKGINYVLEDVSEKEFMKAYIDIQNQGLEVNENNLFTTLASKYKQIKLENLLEAEKRVGVSEEHLNNLRNIQEKNNEHMENHREVLGNEELGIYLNGNEVVTIYYDKEGKKIVEKHDQNANEEENLAEDIVANYDSEQLISFEEYSFLITNRESLAEEELNNIRNMENFLFEIMTYKNYLTPELYELHENFYKLWDYLSTIKETTEVIESAITRYDDMKTRSEQREVNNARNQVTVLQRKLDNSKSYGYVNALLYIVVIVFVIIIITVITILAK